MNTHQGTQFSFYFLWKTIPLVKVWTVVSLSDYWHTLASFAMSQITSAYMTLLWMVVSATPSALLIRQTLTSANCKATEPTKSVTMLMPRDVTQFYTLLNDHISSTSIMFYSSLRLWKTRTQKHAILPKSILPIYRTQEVDNIVQL